MRSRLTLAVLASIPLFAVMGACTSQPPSGGDDDAGTHRPDVAQLDGGGFDAGFRQDAHDGIDASLDAGDSAVVDAGPGCFFPFIPAGWRRVECGCCDLWAPESLEDIPPIEWESCAYDGSVDCRIMRITWTDGIARFNVARMTTDSEGRPLLAFHRYPVDGDGRLWVLAEADGDVVNAILEPQARTGCAIANHDLNDGRYLIDIFGNARTGRVDCHSAHILTGEVGKEPRHLWQEIDAPKELGAWSSFSRDLVVQWFLGRVEATDWQMQGRQVIYSAGIDPDGLTPYERTVIGTSVFIVVSAGGNSGIVSWTPEDGPRNLLRWPGDDSRGASNLGTDGEVMVWTYGEGKPPGGWYHDYASFSIMTAPFTTDPAQLEATSRRVRAEIGGQLVGRSESWKVGCGFAARGAFRANGLVVVRLADGAAWFLPTVSGLSWGETLGVTCEEIFTIAQTPRGDLVARVKIDSLGAPLPPD